MDVIVLQKAGTRKLKLTALDVNGSHHPIQALARRWTPIEAPCNRMNQFPWIIRKTHIRAPSG
jgi:hypothetical protein